LVISIVLWRVTATPPATLEQLGEAGGSERAAAPTQERTLALTSSGGRVEAQSQVETTSQSAPLDADTANPNDTPASRSPDALNTPGARISAARAEEEPVAPMLSAEVFAVIEDVQQKQLDGQWDESLQVLNALYENFDELNNFEKITLLNFYTNTLLKFEMWPEAIGAFSRMLTVPDLRPDWGARALVALGQLHAEVGEYAASISYLTSWQELTADMENMQGSNERVAQLLAQSRLAAQQATLEEQ
tara:strand:- start:381 stop:1121 length:741 start_codon:yes stop_codon:yes gene_type:complete